MTGSRGLQTKRDEIARELEEIEARMAALVREFEGEVRTRMSPAAFLRRHPIGAVTGSTILGVLATGLLGKKASKGLLRQLVRAFAARWVARWVTRIFSDKKRGTT